jgi:hypothetical protein
MLAMDEWGGSEVERQVESWVMRGKVGMGVRGVVEWAVM